MSTNVVSQSNIKRSWHVFDAKDQILGRLAVEVAGKLSGKSKTNFVPYLDMGDYVVVTNASLVKVTGKKSTQKIYFRHSGYPGGAKEENFERLISRRPAEVIRHAVWGMMPKTKLGKKMMTKLKIYASSTHPYTKEIKGAKQEEVANA